MVRTKRSKSGRYIELRVPYDVYLIIPLSLRNRLVKESLTRPYIEGVEGNESVRFTFTATTTK